MHARRYENHGTKSAQFCRKSYAIEFDTIVIIAEHQCASIRTTKLMVLHSDARYLIAGNIKAYEKILFSNKASQILL